MSTEQIREDLYTIGITWPEGVPMEQADHVNALRRELKRRGVDLAEARAETRGEATRQAQRSAPAGVDVLSRDALEKELRDLSTLLSRGEGDEETQSRFADVRYELRRRARQTDTSDAGVRAVEKTAGVERAATTLPPVPVRQLELPEDAAETLIDRIRRRKPDSPEAPLATLRNFTPSSDEIAAREASRKVQDAVETRWSARRSPKSVAGYTVSFVPVNDDVGPILAPARIILEHEVKTDAGSTVVDAQRMTREQARELGAWLLGAVAASGED